MAEEEPFRFLDLPVQVRNLIYSLWVSSPTPIHPYFPYRNYPYFHYPRRDNNPINSALLAASRQINQEATAVFKSKNVGVICDLQHDWNVHHCTLPSIFKRLPNDWDLNEHDRRLEDALWDLAAHYEPSTRLSATSREWRDLVRIRERNDDMLWSMISRLDHVLINVNWIDARFFGILPMHWHHWHKCELRVIYMLRPFHDLVMRGEASTLKTVVMSLR